MKNISIAQRIVLMIVTAVVALLLIGTLGLDVARKGTKSNQEINEVTQNIKNLASIRHSFLEARTNMYVIFLDSADEKMDAVEKRLSELSKVIEKQVKDYEANITDEEDKKLIATDVANIKEFMEMFRSDALPQLRRYENEKARVVMQDKLGPLGEKTLKGFDDHLAYKENLASDAMQKSLDGAALGRNVSLTVIVLGVAAVVILGIFLLTNIKSSLRQIQSMVHQIESDLDFTIRVDVRKQDEIGQTTSALNRLLDKLQDNLKSLANGARTVAASAHQMVTTSNEVAAASNMQSEAASNMAATVEEMTVSINHVADRAQEANRLSSESGQLATTGEKVIGQTVADIQDIATTVNEAAALIAGLEQHSQQISNVVAVIKEVADQTNLLALNAAIEAARAGEQGRGFAVVADEVRKLAERTSSSTQEIARTIDAMRGSASNAVGSMQTVVSKVTAGVERAQEANTAIHQIGGGSRNAVAMVEEIASAIREQGSATNNIAIQVERIAQMSEESSASAGHSADSANALDQLAAEMQKIVGSYRL